jgi:hypothetical protein
MTGGRLTFGIYPLGVAGTPTGLATGPPDDYERIGAALRDLGGPSGALPARTYAIYAGPASAGTVLDAIGRYRDHGILAHLVVGCLQEPGIDLPSWQAFLAEVVTRYGPDLRSLQITNEPNLSFMEGSKPYIVEAIVHGVITAKQEVGAAGLAVPIGFGSVPDSPAALAGFWSDLARAADGSFRDAVDFVGHNFYVDVFEEPLPRDQIARSVERILCELRERNLVTAGIPHDIPIRVTENGWPTGVNPLDHSDRTYEAQADVLDIVIRAVDRLRSELNITHYDLFGLRDADSSNDELFHQFGILRDDYTPKPAFHAFRHLVDELGAGRADATARPVDRSA